MSFEVEVVKRRGDVEIACRFASTAGVTVLFGPSGAGKTSVLDMIAGLLRPDYGHIRVSKRTLFEDKPIVANLWDHIDLPPEQRRAGYVFQDARLFPHLTVRENLAYGCARAQASARPDRPPDDPWTCGACPTPHSQSGPPPSRGYMSSIDFLGIDHLLDRWPRSLSGGEARRVAIGRALLSDPAFLLLDEPLASLDRPRRDEVMAALEHLRDRAALPILLVTHDRAEAERLGAHIVELG